MDKQRSSVLNPSFLVLGLQRYCQKVDETFYLTSMLKEMKQISVPYKTERQQWQSSLHKLVTEVPPEESTNLDIDEQAIAELVQQRDNSKLKFLPENSCSKVGDIQLAPSSFAGQKRKYDSITTIEGLSEPSNLSALPSKNLFSVRPDVNESPSTSWSSETVPRANGTGSFVPKTLSTGVFIKSSSTLWGTVQTPESNNQQERVEPNRKYTSTLPPIIPHPSYNRVNQEPANRQPPPEKPAAPGNFRTAREELVSQNIKRYGTAGGSGSYNPVPQPQTGQKRSLGTRRGGAFSKFVAPRKISEDGNQMYDNGNEDLSNEDERLKNIEPKMIELITNEIMYVGKPVQWDDIAGLKFAKETIQEIVVWPLLRPELFTGLRGPPKGILLFGPPGTGKTLIGKCIASQSKSTFFSISASCLTSKWVGEGEKMVRALFAVARVHQPSVVFIDEIDSLLSQRSDTEHESSRRIKTEFLVQLDGATTAEEDRILVVGATNRPQELDEAARRRLVKRLYIPLPEVSARAQIVCHLMSGQRCTLSDADVELVATMAEGFSGADMRDLCREASYGPIRAIHMSQIESIDPSQVRPVTLEDFKVALQQVRPSVSSKDLQSYEKWNETYGYGKS